MARTQKELTVILLDVGEAMTRPSSAPLEAAVRGASTLIQQKILHGKKDELALVLFGSRETHNNLADDGYTNIAVVSPLQEPSIKLLELLETLEPGEQAADFIDALVVGMDLAATKAGTRAVKKTIFLFTNGGCSVNEDDLQVIVDELKKQAFRLNVIGIDFDNVDEDGTPIEECAQKSKTKRYNEELLRDLCTKVHGEESQAVVIRVEEAQWSLLRKEPESRNTTFRGMFEITPAVSIPMWTYLRISETKFPTATKISKLSPDSAVEDKTGLVEIERSLYGKDDPDKEVQRSATVKGYRYGKSLVTFTEADEENLKFEDTAGLKLLGFTERANIPRAHFLGNVEVMTALPGDNHAAIAASALIHALLETDRVAIVRFVKRNKAQPQLGALFPHVKPYAEFFYYVKLPFLEDIRPYPFAALHGANLRPAFRPSPAQLDACERLINSLDLDYDNTLYHPKLTRNPVLEYFYRTLQHRALHPDSELLPISTDIKSAVEPQKNLLRKAEAALGEVRQLFPLAKGSDIQEKTAQRRFWSHAFSDDRSVALDSYVGGGENAAKKQRAEGALSLEAVVGGSVDEVGPLYPVDDFKAMFRRRDVDLVDKGSSIEGMCQVISKFVFESVKQSHYARAVECLIELRLGCVQEDEALIFNDYLTELRKQCNVRRRLDFWALVRQNGVTLINNDECDESEVTVDEAAQFLAETEDGDAVEEADEQPARAIDEEDAEDLLVLIE